MQRTKRPTNHREEATEQAGRLPYDYGAYDTPEVFERMFPGAKAINTDTDCFGDGPNV